MPKEMLTTEVPLSPPPLFSAKRANRICIHFVDNAMPVKIFAELTSVFVYFLLFISITLED